MARPQTDNGPKSKALVLRLDGPTRRKLQLAMQGWGVGWQALGESLVKEWSRHIEQNEPMDIRRASDHIFARMVVSRRRSNSLALG